MFAYVFFELVAIGLLFCSVFKLVAIGPALVFADVFLNLLRLYYGLQFCLTCRDLTSVCICFVFNLLRLYSFFQLWFRSLFYVVAIVVWAILVLLLDYVVTVP